MWNAKAEYTAYAQDKDFSGLFNVKRKRVQIDLLEAELIRAEGMQGYVTLESLRQG